MKLRHTAALALVGWCLAVGPKSWIAEAAGPPTIADLDFFVGDWVIEGEGVDFGGKPFKLNGHYSIERVLDGGWLASSGNFLGAKLREYWGYDSANRKFLRIVFQSNGAFAILRSAGWNDANLLWIGDVSTPDGHRISIRSTQIRKDDNDILVTWERRTDSTWTVYSKERLRRVTK
ncbi:MAG: hypothetical protein ACLQAT_18790 [Candidatus Binataceae bacterium]